MFFSANIYINVDRKDILDDQKTVTHQCEPFPLYRQGQSFSTSIDCSLPQSGYHAWRQSALIDHEVSLLLDFGNIYQDAKSEWRVRPNNKQIKTTWEWEVLLFFQIVQIHTSIGCSFNKSCFALVTSFVVPEIVIHVNLLDWLRKTDCNWGKCVLRRSQRTEDKKLTCFELSKLKE